MFSRGLGFYSFPDLLSPQQDEKVQGSSGVSGGLSGEADEDEDEDEDIFVAGPAAAYSKKLAPRWQTRVFATEIVRKLIGLCEAERAHFDLALAKELQLSGGKSN